MQKGILFFFGILFVFIGGCSGPSKSELYRLIEDDIKEMGKSNFSGFGQPVDRFEYKDLNILEIGPEQHGRYAVKVQCYLDWDATAGTAQYRGAVHIRMTLKGKKEGIYYAYKDKFGKWKVKWSTRGYKDMWR